MKEVIFAGLVQILAFVAYAVIVVMGLNFLLTSVM